MLMTVLEETVNGWRLDVYGVKDSVVKLDYERFVDAVAARNLMETQYAVGKIKPVEAI